MVTTPKAYYALVNLYCATNGWFNERIQHKLIKNNPSKQINSPVQGILGLVDVARFDVIDKTLKKDGYAFFEEN